MIRGGPLPALAAVVVAALALPASASAALDWRPCEDGRECARLRVPLDRSGAVPGTVSLRVLRAGPIRRPAAGAVLVVGGDPGQSAIHAFGGEYGSGGDLLETMRGAAPRKQVLVLDQRGTGGSGPLRCRDLEAASPTDSGRAAEACAVLLGPRRALYRTAETVEDIESLRAELGVERLTILGVGYGSYVAQRYALRHPDRTDRLVLDGAVDADGLDPLWLDSFAAARRVLPLLCRVGCGRFTRDPVGDTARLARRIAGEPLRGYVVGQDGSRRPASLAPEELAFTARLGDRDLLARLGYPAAVVSALRGDTAPLFRLERRARLAARGRRPSIASPATRAAILCEEVRFPWSWHATPAERAGGARAAGALIDAELARPFGVRAAVRSDLMRLCGRWPTASPAPPAEAGPMPGVPVLILAAETDLLAPLETARRAAERLPQASLVVAPRIFGGAVLSGEQFECASRALTSFMTGRAAATPCPRSRALFPPGRPAPASLSRLDPAPGVPGRRGQVLRAVDRTFSDLTESVVFSTLLGPDAGQESFDRVRGTGLRGGSYAFGPRWARVERVEFVPGVRLSTRAKSGEEDFALRVDGPGALDGRLRLRSRDDARYSLRGRLGGRRVRTRLRFKSRLLEAFYEVEVARADRP